MINAQLQISIKRCWDECMQKSNYIARRTAVGEFNKLNRWRKRGITMVPTGFGIAFTAVFLNQTGALIHIYTDGSVLLSHGGTEMGQGLHTKMLQVASKTLGIPVDKIHIAETATDKVILILKLYQTHYGKITFESCEPFCRLTLKNCPFRFSIQLRSKLFM